MREPFKDLVVELRNDLTDLKQAKSFRSIRAGVKKVLADLEHSEVKEVVGDTKIYEEVLTGFLEDKVGFEDTEVQLASLVAKVTESPLKQFIGMLKTAEVEPAMDFYDHNKDAILEEKPGIESIVSTIIDEASAKIAARALSLMKTITPKKATIEYGTTDENMDEIYVKIDTPEDFDRWCVEGGWNDAAGFAEATSVSFEEIRGVWFTTFQDRVLTLDEVEAANIIPIDESEL